MKKEIKLAPGVIVDADGVLRNKSGKRVNYNGEEIIEIDAKAYMRAMELKLYSGLFIFLAFVPASIFIGELKDPAFPLSDEDRILVLLCFCAFIGIAGVLKFLSNWKRCYAKKSNYIVSLPKSSVKGLDEAASVLGVVDYTKAYLDRDGDGIVLLTEAFTSSEDDVLEKIQKVDAAFSMTDFKDYVENVFTIVQSAWSHNDYKKLRPYESDVLYLRHKLRIESMIDGGVTNKRTNVRVKGLLLKDFLVTGSIETLVVVLTANMKVEDKEGMYITENGDIPYILKFIRKRGVKTKKEFHRLASNCPNCGAVIDVDADGVCKYCDTSLVSGETEWVLSEIRNIKISGM